MANCFLLFISSFVSNMLPRYLHFFQLSSPCLLILYSSVLVSLTFRFLFLSLVGISVLI